MSRNIWRLLFPSRIAEQRSRALERKLDDALTLLVMIEERSRVTERTIADTMSLLSIVEARSRTLVYQASQNHYIGDYQIDVIQKWYTEYVQRSRVLLDSRAVRATENIILETEHPIAYESNDHLKPDSTAEGVFRPTRFVRNCIDVLGPGIRCLDLGTGAAGLPYEWLMNGVPAVGVDGSDYCRRSAIGYWPILPKNLFTCDITKPFQFLDDGSAVEFEIITMWEVFEHLAEVDLESVLKNIRAHLTADGYVLGSISLMEYNDDNGNPYHVTLRPKTWWANKFRENGLLMIDDHPFSERLFCRGNGPRFQDFHNYFSNPADGFHFVAKHC
ncbi:methyltransferase domain-containing protein [Rhizobium sp. S163]|uniref:class I SAM-dependent methyltransferase n=1 Tax=Rhizobium sp. S163 TaxID=3055039 RepID=UPI0025A9A020|nr:methyltransferase domain-containing protein [Rhizobium sp. S163]MDM9646679.1 methyltransferase domain-containing protein [Rhizobium sp. S163]